MLLLFYPVFLTSNCDFTSEKNGAQNGTLWNATDRVGIVGGLGVQPPALSSCLQTLIFE